MGVSYRPGSFRPQNIFQYAGSVFPYSFGPALVCGIASSIIKYILLSEVLQPSEEWIEKILLNNAAFTAFSVLISFLITFRTAKAYDRFWNGCNYIKKMQAEFFVTASNLIAFCRHSNDEKKGQFQHTLIRLLSMLHAVALQQLEVGGEGVNIAESSAPCHELIDVKGIDSDTLRVIRNEECRVELIIQWVQSLTVDGIKSGVCTIPPPILSRIFQNLSNALTAYYSAYRVTEVPYPFPYVQTTEVLLIVQMFVAPIVVQSFTSGPFWAFVCSFLAMFTILSLNFIAAELENPFKCSPNVLNMFALQREFNKRLLLLIKSSTNKVPKLSEKATMEEEPLQCGKGSCFLSFADIWELSDASVKATPSYSSFDSDRESGGALKDPLAAGGAGSSPPPGGDAPAATAVPAAASRGGAAPTATALAPENAAPVAAPAPAAAALGAAEASLAAIELSLDNTISTAASSPGGDRTSGRQLVIGRQREKPVRTVVSLEEVDLAHRGNHRDRGERDDGRGRRSSSGGGGRNGSAEGRREGSSSGRRESGGGGAGVNGGTVLDANAASVFCGAGGPGVGGGGGGGGGSARRPSRGSK
eukprot:TRINITY_DN369_c1_g2_i1.p1 TRINITY_DN369_c1_g2~~TRINITY_DN369_c1_g2_i1.p1  ORF type:complete len:588 (+),score=135.97 TRINITY_DN369_c1_g2_i1:191-1954(+)